MEQVTQAIEQAIAKANNLKTNPSANKKFLNKTIARLEDAWLYSQHLAKDEVKFDRASLDSLAPPANMTAQTLDCICPDGAIDDRCPVHGGIVTS